MLPTTAMDPSVILGALFEMTLEEKFATRELSCLSPRMKGQVEVNYMSPLYSSIICLMNITSFIFCFILQSLKMLDSFLSRTLHHVMGPLHALRGTCELISGRLQDHTSDDVHERERNCVLLERAVDTVTLTTRMVADVSDLARFGKQTYIIRINRSA
jgi:hypothetical protein